MPFNSISDAPPHLREGVPISRIWVTVALSLLLHLAVFWKVETPLRHLTVDDGKPGQSRGGIAVRLAPPAAPRMPSAEPPPPAVPKTARPPPQSVARPAGAVPPVIAMNKPQPALVNPSAPAADTTPQSRPAVDGDFAASIEARRRTREGATPPQPQPPSPGMDAPTFESEADRARRIAAVNLAPKQIAFGYDPAAGGGVFQIRRISLNDAEVAFYGWSREIRRKTLQILEISKGSNPDIRLAVVRRMIAVIREYEADDFQWESRRLGRSQMLSARTRDNARLEDFMMMEFFPDQTVAR